MFAYLSPFTIEVVLVFLCLRFAGHPGDGGWYELKCDVAMVFVTLGDSQQALQWKWAEATFHFGLNITEENAKGTKCRRISNVLSSITTINNLQHPPVLVASYKL